MRYEAMALLQEICSYYHNRTDEFTQKVNEFINQYKKYEVEDEFSVGMFDTLVR